MANSIYTKKLKSEADSYGIGINELVMADLMSIGYQRQDAFYVAFPEYASKSVLEANNIMSSIASEDKFKSVVKDRSRRHNAPSDAAVDGTLIDSQQAALEILRVAQSLPENSKERGEMFVKYSEMLRKNSETVDTGNDHVNDYMPIRCTVECPLYKEWRKTHDDDL